MTRTSWPRRSLASDGKVAELPLGAARAQRADEMHDARTRCGERSTDPALVFARRMASARNGMLGRPTAQGARTTACRPRARTRPIGRRQQPACTQSTSEPLP